MLRFGKRLVRRYFRHRVGTQGAALAFYLLFMIFPFLIFLSALLGLLQLDVAAILTALEGIVPREAVEIVGAYLRHVQSNKSRSLVLFGLVFSLWFPTRAAGFFALCGIYTLAQDRRPRWRVIWPGTAFALFLWLALSWGYSLYVENFADYPALYGSIGTVIVVLIWLNLTAVVLILGAEVNGILAHRTEKEREDTV